MSAGTGLTSVPGTIVYTDDQRAGRSENYVLATGASNALLVTLTTIGGAAVTLAAGFRMLVKTANTLQAGANTIRVSQGTVTPIVNMGGNNIKTTVASGAILDLVYDGTNFVLLNSTY